MKNLLSAALLFVLTSVNAQQVSDYPYIIIQRDFNGFQNNEFKLKSHLTQQLKDKNFQVYSSAQSNWPDELLQNQCLALTANVIKQKSAFRNKLEVTFKDCTSKVIQVYSGNSSIKEFEPGYQDALKLALNQVPLSNPKLDVLPKLTNSTKIKDLETKGGIYNDPGFAPKQKVPTQLTDLPEPSGTKVEFNQTTFTDGTIDVHKIDLKEGGFILMNPKSMQAIAKFSPTLRQNIYRVVVSGVDGSTNYNTIGYLTDKGISYEVLEQNTWIEKVFKIK